mmetsp:Transcript_8449/g.31264  ORF Transcript_8449/g.31264 Transcript_8449/m.31264 type:complete len:676 (-) Transcript_8449:3291-5318(-)
MSLLSNDHITASILIPKKLSQYTSCVYVAHSNHQEWSSSSCGEDSSAGDDDDDIFHRSPVNHSSPFNASSPLLPETLFILPNPNISLSLILTSVIKMERQRIKELKFLKSSSTEQWNSENQKFRDAYGSVRKWELVIYIIEELQDEFTSLICVLFWILLEKLQRRTIVYNRNHVEDWSLDDKFAEIWTQIILKIPTQGRFASFSSHLSYSDLIHFLGLVLFRLFMFVFPDNSQEFHEMHTRKWTLSECNYFIFGRDNQVHLHVREGSRTLSGPLSGRSQLTSARSSRPTSSRVHTARSSFRGTNSGPSSRRNSVISSARSTKSAKDKKKIPFVPQHSLFLMPSDNAFSERADFRLETQKTIQEESEKAAQHNGAAKMTLKSLREAEDSERLRKKIVLKRLETDNKDLLSFNALDGLVEEMDTVEQTLTFTAATGDHNQTSALDAQNSAVPHSARTTASTGSTARQTKRAPQKPTISTISNSNQHQTRTSSDVKRGQAWFNDQKVKKKWYEQGKGGLFKIKKPKPINPKGFYTSATDYRTGPLIKRYLRTLHQEQRDAVTQEKDQQATQNGLQTPSSSSPSEFNATMRVPAGDSFFITNQDMDSDNSSAFLEDSQEPDCDNDTTPQEFHECEEEYYSPFTEDEGNTNELLRTLEEDEGYVDSFEETHHSLRGYILE